MGEYYILKGKEIVPAADIIEWAKFFAEDKSRVIFQSRFTGPDREQVLVSTVFLGIDHSYHGGPPILFETMIFGLTLPEDYGEYQERYSTWDEAMEGHNRACDIVIKKSLKLLN